MITFSKNAEDVFLNKSAIHIFKNQLHEDICIRLIEKVRALELIFGPNEKYNDNWFYIVDRPGDGGMGSKFFSFLLNNVPQLPKGISEEANAAFQSIFKIHSVINNIKTDSFLREYNKCVYNPLIFHYPPLVGKFEWHRHETTYQSYQVLLNITKRGRDYEGGETSFRMDNGDIVTLGDEFDQGDIFVFPYHLEHKVGPIISGGRTNVGRISVLMPFHPRAGIKTYF